MPLMAGCMFNYHLTQCGRAHDCQAKGRSFKSHLRRSFSLHPTYLHLWALWVPGEESWGRSNTEERSQEGQMKINPSLNVVVQSAKSGCKRTVNKSFILIYRTYIKYRTIFKFEGAVGQFSEIDLIFK